MIFFITLLFAISSMHSIGAPVLFESANEPNIFDFSHVSYQLEDDPIDRTDFKIPWIDKLLLWTCGSLIVYVSVLITFRIILSVYRLTVYTLGLLTWLTKIMIRLVFHTIWLLLHLTQTIFTKLRNLIFSAISMMKTTAIQCFT